MPTKNESKRKWSKRFGLKTMLVLVAGMSLVMGLVVLPYKIHRDTIIELRELGVEVRQEDSPLDPLSYYISGQPFPEPGTFTRWLYTNVPNDYLLGVTDVTVNPSTTDLDRATTLIGRLRSPGRFSSSADLEARHIKTLRKAGNIDRISFYSDSHVSKEVLKELGEIHWLKTLNFLNCTIEPEGMRHLKELKSVETMFLRCKTIDDDSLEFLAGLKSLTWLEIETKGIQGSGLRHLKSLNKMERLMIVDVAFDDTVSDFLASMPNMRMLDIAGAKVTDASLKHLANAQSLRSVDFSESKVTGEGLKHFANHSRLRGLTIVDAPISQGLEHLASCSALECVVLSSTELSDECLEQLSSSESLQIIRMNDTKITGAGIRSLCKIPTLKWIGQNAISPQEAKTIQIEFPHVTEFDY